jgi:hypothetical protein
MRIMLKNEATYFDCHSAETQLFLKLRAMWHSVESELWMPARIEQFTNS